MMSYTKATLDQCLLVSPIVDMRAMIMKNGEHWFHTPEQLKFLADWFQKNMG